MRSVRREHKKSRAKLFKRRGIKIIRSAKRNNKRSNKRTVFKRTIINTDPQTVPLSLSLPKIVSTSAIDFSDVDNYGL